MSQRAHFWLRITGLCVIVLAQVYPRLVPSSGRDAAPRAQQAELARR